MVEVGTGARSSGTLLSKLRMRVTTSTTKRILMVLMISSERDNFPLGLDDCLPAWYASTLEGKKKPGGGDKARRRNCV